MRQTTPPQRFVAEANKQPEAAHASSELLADEEPPTPAQWFWCSPFGWLAIAALIAVLFIVATALPRPE